MKYGLEQGIVLCPVCSQELNVNIPRWRVPAELRDLLEDTETLVALSQLFHEKRSLEEAARAVSISSERASRVLNFLSVELCGCRAVTCISCLDDYRSEL